MKRFFVSTATVLTMLAANSAFAGKATPMNVVEKSSYQLSGLVSKGKIDASFLTDVTHLSITSDNTGFKVTMFSPSADTNTANTLTIVFDQNGKAVSYNANFASVYPAGPVFSHADAATILDLAAEAIVDHLSESPDNITVAEQAQTLELQPEGSGVLVLITLSSGHVYSIHMDQDAKVISQGF